MSDLRLHLLSMRAVFWFFHFLFFVQFLVFNFILCLQICWMKYLITRYKENTNNLGTFNLEKVENYYNQLFVPFLIDLFFFSAISLTIRAPKLHAMLAIQSTWKIWLSPDVIFTLLPPGILKSTEWLLRLKNYFQKRIKVWSIGADDPRIVPL